ncbi:MAG: P-type conjugative transfer protein TrbL [Comamonas sp.]
MAPDAPTVARQSGRIGLACGIGLVLMLLASPAAADLSNLRLLDTVVEKFSTQARTWQSVMMNAATWLFWTLGTISLAWTGGMMVLRKADMGEFFAEFIRFILFFGFFLWLLRNGPAFAASIIESMQRLGANATQQSSVTPSVIVDIGFAIWQQAVSNISTLNLVSSLVGILLSAAILLLLAAVAVNMLLMMVSGWVLMYAGIFFLGFGGSRWTSDMAINYYKSVLGVGVQLMTMVLLVGIGSDLLRHFYTQMDHAANNLNEMIVMLVFCLVLLMLTSKVPAMVAGLVTGGAGASSNLGSFGAGAVMGAAMGAAGAVSAAAGMGGAAMRAGAANASGIGQAVMAAYTQSAGSGAGDGGAMVDTAGNGESADGASVFAEMDFGRGGERGATGAGTGGDSGASMDSDSSGSDKRGESRGGSSSADGAGRGSDHGSHSSKPGTSDEGGGGGTSSGQATGSAQGDHGSSEALGNAQQKAGGFGRALATAGHLAQGWMAVEQEKSASRRAQARERVDATVGARIAVAIQRANAPPTTGRAEGRAQRTAEVTAFVQRDSSKG